MNEKRIAELLAPFFSGSGLSEDRLQSVRTYLELLLKWNSRINLTAIRDSDEIVRRHFGESFFAARHVLPQQNEALEAIDIGSGAGFPGLPLKIWDKRLRLKLVESNQRKATFLGEAVRRLGFDDVEVSRERAEKLVIGADLVTFRAVERFARILPVACRLLKPGGRIALLIVSSQIEPAIACSQIRWGKSILIPDSRERVLLTGTLAAG